MRMEVNGTLPMFGREIESGAEDLRLRGYQMAAVDELRSGLAQGHLRQILCSPTGSGKTETAIYLMERAYTKGSRVSFVADRIVLVEQTSRRLRRYGIPHGVAQGQNTFGRGEPLQVCSAQTIERRDYFQDLDVLILDEAHTVRSKIVRFAESWNGPVVGLTATPLTTGLGRIYSRVVSAVSTNDLLDAGWLAPLRVYVMREIDMTGEPVGSTGEWTGSQVRRRSGSIIGDMVEEWRRMTTEHFGGPVKTLVFSADVSDGERICEAFRNGGFDFRQSTYRDSAEDTATLLAEFERGEFCGLTSVDKFTKGFDVPDVRCMIGARPYSSSLANFLQQLGRGMRTAPDKDYCLYLDFAGNMEGWYEDVMDFWAEGVSTLDTGQKIQPRRSEGGARTARRCACGLVVGRDDEKCPGCSRPLRKPRQVDREIVRGRMEELAVAPGSRRWMENREWTWMQMCRVAASFHRKPDIDRMRRFAEIQYRSLYGEWPKWKFRFDLNPPDRRVERRVRKQLAEYRRSQREGDGAA